MTQPVIMKKLIVLSIAFLVSNFCLSQISLGLKSGYTKAWDYYGNVNLPADAEIHIHSRHLSLMVYKQMNERYSLGIEPGYVKRGAACVPGWIPTFVGDSRIFVDYLEFPVLINMNFNLVENDLILRVKMGAGVSMGVHAEEEVTLLGSDEPSTINDLDFNQIGGLNRWDCGMYSGLGVSYQIKNGEIFIESSYYHGVRDIDPNTTSENRSINISLGYLWNLASIFKKEERL